MMKRLAAATGLALALSACNGQYDRASRHLQPIPPKTMALMAEKGMAAQSPILIRSYKKESELEVWKQAADGRYALLKSYPICRWSGQLGPKVKEGDRQAPEGFYAVTPAQMNPNSAYYLSFDTGYPNAYDRAHHRTGSALMYHGNCSSRGCFAMTDEAIAEVYALGREAHAGGQRAFQVQSLPFRMTPENFARHRADPHMAFWRNLKEGADYFEVAKLEPRVNVCGGRYGFNTDCKETTDPEGAELVAEKRERDNQAVAELVEKGMPAIRLVYADGGQHQSFRIVTAFAPGTEVSRPDALAEGPKEIALADAILNPGKRKGERAGDKAATALAEAQTARSAETRLAAKPAASAEPEATEIAEAKPLYKKLLGNLFGADEKATEPVAPAATPATAPLPPRRAAAPAADRRADAGPSPASSKPATMGWMSFLPR